MKVRNVERSPQCMAACMMMPPRWALAGAHFEKHNHQLSAAKINDHTSIQIYFSFAWWLPAPSQYMLLEEWVLASSRFSRMQSYATTLYKENFISIQLLECTSEAQTASMRITSASNLLNAEGRSSSCSQATAEFVSTDLKSAILGFTNTSLLSLRNLSILHKTTTMILFCWTQEGRSSSCCQATAEFVSSDLKRRFLDSRTLM
jgi:hypothetical protein